MMDIYKRAATTSNVFWQKRDFIRASTMKRTARKDGAGMSSSFYGGDQMVSVRMPKPSATSPLPTVDSPSGSHTQYESTFRRVDFQSDISGISVTRPMNNDPSGSTKRQPEFNNDKSTATKLAT